MPVTESIVIGVISGVLASTVVFLLALLFNRVIVPWYQNIIYSGINVSGTWNSESKLPDSKKLLTSLELKQSANNILGSATASIKHSEEQIDPVRILSVTGKINDRFVQLTITPVDAKRLGAVSVLSEVVGHGNRMKGWSIWYSDHNADLNATSHIWERS